MDGAEDGLAVAAERVEEVEDGPGGLAVETRGGLVEEDEELGAGGEFDADGKTLSLFYVEA